MRSKTCPGGLILALSVSLFCGCAQDKKDDSSSSPPKTQSSSSPDGFETVDNPPLTSNTRFAAGQLAESMGNLDSAAMQYREALKLDPKNVQAMYRLGSVLTQQKKFGEAVTVWQDYMKLTKNSPASYNNLAYCYELAGRLDYAEQTYKLGIERDPKDISCRVNYGLLLARHDRLDDAVKQLNTVLKPAEVSYNLGSCYEQMGKIEEAKAYYRNALRQDPNLKDAKARLAALQ